MNKVIERIITRPAQPGMVGDGFRVFNYIPRAGIDQHRISPFLMLDFNAAYDFGPSDQPRGVDVHPHKGFETVTIAYKGSVAHYDSSGNSGVIHPGDVQWMTAGEGILHKEFHEESFSRQGGLFEMVQLWVNLPQKYKSEAPHYQALTSDNIPQVHLPEHSGIVSVIAGNYEKHNGAAKTYTPINLFNIKLNEGGSFSTAVNPKHNTAILIVNGSAEINGSEVREHEFVLFGKEGENIQITAKENSMLLLLSGEPIEEPIVSYGPFVMNTEAEIRQAIYDYNMGKFGVLD